MIEISPLKKLELADLERVASGYTSNGKYEVAYSDSENQSSIRLQFVETKEPYVKQYDHYDRETFQQYQELLNNGFSFGAYEDDLLVALILAEAREWNRSLWVWEFHVAETHRKRGIGKRLMERAAESAKRIHLRTIVCETQNTNANAIHVYRKLGFRVEGVDISYYTNNDHPDGEVAVFMKRRL
ncbi:MAG: GNAT family N-acetyltransferase [Chloroflexi bacterium]|nr:GNAT family N-acetyltransferase [Chloroflexota bacterium]